MILALDAMGGDHGPVEICKGAAAACSENPDLELVLVGKESMIAPLLDDVSSKIRKRISIIHAEEQIGMDEHPTIAIRKKRNSSLRLAMEMVRSGEASGCISAGNTGAIVAGGVLVVGRISGIDRPAFGVALPTLNKYTFLLDVGATVRSRPLNLFQFAHMGNIYSKKILGVASPQVALLANGSEEIKGDEVIVSAKELLKTSSLNFTGYVEGDDIPYSSGCVPVFVNVDDYFFRINTEPFGCLVDNSLVCLVEKPPRNIFRLESRFQAIFFQERGDDPVDKFENIIAFHRNVMKLLFKGLPGGRILHEPPKQGDLIVFCPVRPHVSRYEMSFAVSGRSEHHSSGTVTEKNTGVPVCPVNNPGKYLCPYHEHIFPHA